MIKKFFLTALCILITNTGLFAHPHIFFTEKVEVVFNSRGLSGFRTTWLADDFSTAGLTDGYDENENGTIDPAELKLIREDSYLNLKNFNYFTCLKINGKEKPVGSVSQFETRLNKNRIEYEFFVPCPVPFGSGPQTVILSQYDSSYFCFITFDEKTPVHFTGAESASTEYKIRLNKNKAYYFNMVHPYEMTLRFRKK